MIDSQVSLDEFTWVWQMLLIPAVAFCIWLAITMLNLLRMVKTTLKMHNSPDEHGFGNTTTNLLLNKSIEATNRNTHYLKHAVEAMTGKPAPPPPPQEIQL